MGGEPKKKCRFSLAPWIQGAHDFCCGELFYRLKDLGEIFGRPTRELRKRCARPSHDLRQVCAQYCIRSAPRPGYPKIEPASMSRRPGAAGASRPGYPQIEPASKSRCPGAAGAAGSAPSKYLSRKLNIKSLFLDPARILMGLWIMDYEIMRL